MVWNNVGTSVSTTWNKIPMGTGDVSDVSGGGFSTGALSSGPFSALGAGDTGSVSGWMNTQVTQSGSWATTSTEV